ncbi:integrin alpha-7-like isoform X1 [Penaeus chinensis]|uniref:integrin alpha-7-like isoform X1 n=2 Tax=Penaeus chinensis TaxID=139456 RepID=UPI001FB5E4A3|nr:integrin alpha-7-like isoform X1 [Penaeus chinensis]
MTGEKQFMDYVYRIFHSAFGRSVGKGTMKVMQCAILVLVLTSLTSAFNLEPRESIIFSDKTRGQVPEGRESYFGFSVALHFLAKERATWLAVGAPRANSSYYNPDHITEPGAIFKCDLRSQECEELHIDQEGNSGSQGQSSQFSYFDLKNGGWLGGAMDSQPTYQAGRQSLGVCAPRWKNQLYQGTYLMNGACYWLNSSLPNAPAHKMLPLVQFSKQTFPIGGRSLFFYSHGGAGLSIHFTDDPTEMIVGAPGVFNWQGTVIRFKDAGLPPIGEISRRRRRRQTLVSEHQMFSSQFVPNPYYTSSIKDFDLLGYSVTSGHFLSTDEILYAAGATRGANSLGKVLLFAFPRVEEMGLYVIYEWVGTQIGENFGASLAAADINGDGLSDLVVGAPMFFTPDATDMGKVVVYTTYIEKGEATIEVSDRRYYGSAKAGARFGTTLAACGDLNQDGFQDIAVGAPYEDGHGAVYIYLGSPQGLRSKFSQHLLPQHFSAPFSGLGMSISRGIDIDGNGYPDLAIGSFLSGHAAVLRSRPVVTVWGSVSSRPSSVALNDTSLQLVVCFNQRGVNVPSQIGIKGNITLDYEFPSPRAFFPDTNAYVKTFSHTAVAGDQRCKEYAVKLKADKIDARQPILMKAEWELDHAQSSDLLSLPITDPGLPVSATEHVGIITGCEKDGDETCRVDLRVETTLSNQETAFVIGSEDKPSITVSVFNTGEPVFLPNVTVSVDSPLALMLPNTHSCNFPNADNRTFLACHLRNPIMPDEKDEIKVTIDINELDDRATSSAIRVEVAGEGTEARPQDNAAAFALHMGAQASLKLHGYSKEEQILYQRLEENKINTTITPRFLHYFSLVKKGPTPLSEVELIVDIPVNFTTRGRSDTFLNIHAHETNFQNQRFQCNMVGATYVPDEELDGEDMGISFVLTNSSTLSSINEYQKTSSMQSKESSLLPVSLNCSNPLVSCARLSCLIKSWPAWTSFADLTINLSLNLTVLAGHISAKGGAVVKSYARARISSLNPQLSFVGDKKTEFVVMTQVQPDSLPGRGVPWWVILLAVLGGLLLLCLLAYGLYKAGFFKRKEQDEMKAHRAQMASNNYGTVNDGMVGD